MGILNIAFYVVFITFALIIGNWMLSFFIRENIKRYTALVIVEFIVVPVIIISLFKLEDWHEKNKPFDKTEWAENKGERWKHLDPFFHQHILVGKDKQQVKDLLGCEGNEDSLNLWRYHIGYPGFAGFDPAYLQIVFVNNKVVDVNVHEE